VWTTPLLSVECALVPVSTRRRRSWERREGKKRRKKKKKKGAISNLRHKDKKRTTKQRIEKGGIYRDTFTTLSLSFPPSSFPATFHFLLFGFIGRDF
jgi:hypothetical protein